MKERFGSRPRTSFAERLSSVAACEGLGRKVVLLESSPSAASCSSIVTTAAPACLLELGVPGPGVEEEEEEVGGGAWDLWTPLVPNSASRESIQVDRTNSCSLTCSSCLEVM